MKRLLVLSLIIILTAALGLFFVPNARAEAAMGLGSGAGSVGSEISISGSGFLPQDRTCTLSSPSSPGVIISGACVIQDGSLAGGFIVGNVLPGAYVIEATGDYGDFAEAILQVTGGAQFGFSSATGPPGMDVSVHGSGFLPTDTTCTISSPSLPNPILSGTSACVIQGGVAYGSFTIGNVLPGEYVIQINGNQGDSAQTIITVG
jgi:hypothetical protein